MDEVGTIRNASQWKLIRDRGQISEEIQYLLRYYKEVFMSKENCWGTQDLESDKAYKK